MLPDRRFDGWLSETEADIRQDTARELLNGFLAGNDGLRSAVRSRNLRRIAQAMDCCMRTCLANNRKRTIEVEDAHKGTPAAQPTLESVSSKHELEYHMRSRISKLLSSATATRELEQEEIRLLRMLVVDESTRDQAATELKKSHSWISNRLKKIKGKLQKSKAPRRILEADM
jgi:hypothetical protein